MVTSRSMLVFVALVAGCSTGAGVVTEPPAPGPSTTPEPRLPPDTVDPGGAGPSYPGTGFRVHEWGTNTIVVGSDGSMQRGLHHEEEDLPPFVLDRRRSELASEVDTKMETPVTYFYSERPITARVAVQFPKGVLTQWYPSVQTFWPPILRGRGDPALDPRFPFTSAQCRESFGAHAGLLDWGDVQILARDVRPSAPDAPLDRYTWSHARAVAANPVRVTGSGAAQEERFLFYRGLGNLPIAARVAAMPGDVGRDGGLAITNLDKAERLGAVFVLRVERDRAAFSVVPEGVAPSGTLARRAPEATTPIETYVQDLARAMVTELDRAGLYHDESISMVKTWARQWFRTPGVRVLYLAPRAWTDAQIPLTIDPRPTEIARVMVIRVEAITPAQEEVDLAMATKLDTAPAEAEAYFAGLGRFAEPRLRRAMAAMPVPPPAVTAYLDRLVGADVDVRVGE